MQPYHGATPRMRRRPILVAGAAALLVLAGLALWRWPAPPSRLATEPDGAATAAATPTTTAEPGAYPAGVQVATHLPAYPPPVTPLALDRLPPSPTPRPTPDYAAALPDGTVIDWDNAQAYWVYPRGIDGQWARPHAAVPYRLEGVPGVAVLSRSPEGHYRRLWTMADIADLPWQPEAVAIDRVRSRLGSQLPVVVVAGADQALGLVLEATVDAAALRYRLPWPGDLASEWTLEEVDLTGDGQLEAVLSAAGQDPAQARTLVFQIEGGAGRLVAEVAGRLQAVDVDDDGRFELLDVTEPGPARIRRWDGNAFTAAGEFTDAPVPTPAAVVADRLPALPADLYLLGAKGLWRWPRAGGPLRKVTEIDADCVDGWRCSSMEVAPNGTIVLAPGIAGPANPAFRVIDRGGKQREIPTDTAANVPWPGLLAWDLSADGRWLVFLRYAWPSGTMGRPPVDPDPPAQVMVVDLAGGGAARVAADCPTTPAPGPEHAAMGCRNAIAVSPDGGQVAFANGQGLLLAPTTGGEPRVLVPHWFGPSEVDARIYVPVSWSPDGGSLLVNQGGWEGHVTGVVDVASGRYAEIPYTAVYGGPWSSFAWAPDGRSLVHARARDYGEAPTALYRVDAADAAHPLALLPMLDTGNKLNLFAPAVAADGTIRYLSRHADARVFRGNGVFGMTADGGHWRPLAALPPVQDEEDEEAEVFRADTTVWAPGASAWAFGHDAPTGQRLLVGLGDGRATWDATGLVEGLHQLAWGQ